jgi:hypothetical protein
MERLRITELLAEYNAANGTSVTKADLGDQVFGDEQGRPLAGRRRPLSSSRKRTLIGEWDSGKSLTALKPRHVLRLSEFLRAKRIIDLFEE